MKPWKAYAVGILSAEAVGALAGFLTRKGIQAYGQNAAKPPLTPPAVVFPVVWAVLYALMGIGAARAWLSPDSKYRRRSLNLMAVQLIVNFFWSLIFFNAGAYGFAALWLVLLWILVLAMILQMRKVDGCAAWLQVPYLLWLTFAAYLNFGVWVLNG